MTSRRNFLGFILVAPSVAKASISEDVAITIATKSPVNPIAANLLAELEWLQTMPKTLARDWAIVSLNQACAKLSDWRGTFANANW